MALKFDDMEGLAQALFEEAGDALILFDPDTYQILDANSTAQRLSGFPLWDLQRRLVTDLFFSESPAGLRDLQGASRKTRVFHSREGYWLETAQEGVRVSVSLTVVRLHVKPKTLGMVTARQQSEAALQSKEREAELLRMLDSLADCVWSGRIDEAGHCKYRFVSPVIERLAGQPADYFLQGVHHWWGAIHPEDQDIWAKALARQRLGQSTQAEYRIVLPNETTRHVRERVTVSPDAAGGGLRLDGIIGEIAEPPAEPSSQ